MLFRLALIILIVENALPKAVYYYCKKFKKDAIVFVYEFLLRIFVFAIPSAVAEFFFVYDSTPIKELLKSDDFVDYMYNSYTVSISFTLLTFISLRFPPLEHIFEPSKRLRWSAMPYFYTMHHILYEMLTNTSPDRIVCKVPIAFGTFAAIGMNVAAVAGIDEIFDLYREYSDFGQHSHYFLDDFFAFTTDWSSLQIDLHVSAQSDEYEWADPYRRIELSELPDWVLDELKRNFESVRSRLEGREENVEKGESLHVASHR